jgi:thiol:disulfide interchange protein DsbA
MRHIRNIFAALMMLLAAEAFAQSDGLQEYTLLNPPQPTSSGKKIEVLEFFFYGCIHCFHLHPKLSKWEKTMPKDVQLDYVPTSFNSNWEPMAYTYYALKAMGLRKQMDDKLYDAWNISNLILLEQDKIADFMAQQGVDRQKFLDYFNSMSVDTDVKHSKQMMVEYHISGTPTLIVDGRYVIANLLPDDTIRVLNEVVNKVRKERGKS